MRLRFPRLLAVIPCVIAAGLGIPVLAAGTGGQKAQAPTIPAEPLMTTATFGDWQMRCQRLTDAGKTRKVCEITQSMQVQGQAAPIAQVAIGRVQAGDPLVMTVVLPTDISFPSSIRVMADDKDTQPFEVAWRRCLPNRCIAEMAVRDDVLKRWRALTEPGRIGFKDSAGRDLLLPISFRGLPQALDALLREPA